MILETKNSLMNEKQCKKNVIMINGEDILIARMGIAVSFGTWNSMFV